jgi:hypothetical protein
VDEDFLAHELADAMASEAEAGLTGIIVERPLRCGRDVAELSPERFEALCAALFELQGYDTYLTPFVNDGGIDVVAQNQREVVLVQCKHTRARNVLDATVVGELEDGVLYYREKVLPRSFAREHRVRCVLMTNAPRSRSLVKAGRASDTEIIAEKDLLRLLERLEVLPSVIVKWLSSREESLDSLRGILERIAEHR